MKVKIIKSSELGQCWSALRHMDKCADCDKIRYCKLPDADKGRVVLAERIVINAKKNYEDAQASLKKAKEKMGDKTDG